MYCHQDGLEEGCQGDKRQGWRYSTQLVEMLR